jgi:multiple sugar transport system substrate-binding protein
VTQRIGHSQVTRFLAALATVVVIVAACGSPAATPARPSASVAGPGTTAPSTPNATTAPPATTGAASEEPTGEATSAEPSAEASPEVTPVPTPVVVDPGDVPAGAAVIRWYCCLGGGDAPEQVEVERQVIDDWNATHDDVKIAGEFVLYAQAYDTLAAEIAGGNPPDIIGPIGYGGANAFPDRWLDLQPLIDATGYDTSQFESEQVDFFKVGDTQVGLPFAIYPSELYYQRGMFEEIGLAEPPHAYGEDYVVQGELATAAFGVEEGTHVPWDYDTARTLGMLLTVDANGNDATQPEFDPASIVQYGFEPQRDDMRGLAASWAAGSLVGSDGQTVQIPDAWKTAWKWYHAGMYTDHFIVPGPTYESTDWNPDGVPFCNGHVAMGVNFLWSTYCLQSAGDNWDIAAVPAYQGTQTAAFNADTFRIWKDTQHPDEAFEVLQYLFGDASEALTTIYGAMPARAELQPAFFESLGSQFETLQPVDWQVAVDGAVHPDIPNFESDMPHYQESVDKFTEFGSRWGHEADLDMDQQIQSLADELQAIWNE